MIDRYFERFPGVSRYIADTLADVREHGYTVTLFGRKTWLPGIKAQVPGRAAGRRARRDQRADPGHVGADIIKRAMVRMGPALAEAGLGHVRMLLQVHDELVFELPEGDVEAASAVIGVSWRSAAEPAVSLSAPLGVEIGTGPSWGAAH